MKQWTQLFLGNQGRILMETPMRTSEQTPYDVYETHVNTVDDVDYSDATPSEQVEADRAPLRIVKSLSSDEPALGF